MYTDLGSGAYGYGVKFLSRHYVARDVPEHCDPVQMLSEGKGAALAAMQSKARAYTRPLFSST
jgi:hypothetical protein